MPIQRTRMSMPGRSAATGAVVAIALGLASALAHAAVDEDDAKSLAKKDGPSFKETAKKYKGKADAEATLLKHLTSNPKVKVDGKEELHESPKTKDEDRIRNLIRYILAH